MAAAAPDRLIGRERELGEIESFLSRAGPATLVLEGEPGIGKTAIWSAGVDAAVRQGLRVLRARPSESEAAFAFVALGDLLGDALTETLAALPAPQRRALETALLLGDPDLAPLDERAVAAAVLGALRVLAGAGPLLVAIDDLQWLDTSSAAALEFAVRRLRDEPLRLLLTRRLSAGHVSPELELAVGNERVERLDVGL